MNSFSKSFELIKQSFSLLNKDKMLLLFPIFSFAVSVLTLFAVFLPIYNSFDNNITKIAESNLRYPLLFLAYFIIYFITVFFNTSLITCIYTRLNGGNPSISAGLKNSFRHIFTIFLWTIISSTIGIILRIISDKSTSVGKIVAGIIGVAWNVTTYFVVPILVFQNKDVFSSIKESGALFKKVWGEEVSGNVSVGVFFILLIILVSIPMFVGFFFGLFSSVFSGSAENLIWMFIGFAITILAWIILLIVAACINSIFSTALYIYATTGKIPSNYNPDFIKNAFKKDLKTILSPAIT